VKTKKWKTITSYNTSQLPTTSNSFIYQPSYLISTEYRNQFTDYHHFQGDSHLRSMVGTISIR